MSYSEYSSWVATTPARQYQDFAASWAVEAKSDSKPLTAEKFPSQPLNGWSDTWVAIHRSRLSTRSVEIAARTEDARLWVELAELAGKWREETMFASSLTKTVLNESYQRIIGHGERALPFILNDLRESGGLWFPALQAITGADPVPVNDRGDIPAMTAAWLTWAEEQTLPVL
ncbi:MAG: hypothetical protein ABIW82_03885 [Dokdonella sp.]